MDELLKVATIKPMVVQIESNPSFNNNELIQKYQDEGIVMQAWSPLGGLLTSVRENEDIIKIGEKYNKSAVQIIIRWAIDRNVVVLPKSVTKSRIIDNLNVFDFKLTTEEVEAINALKQGIRAGSNPDTFTF